MAAPLSVQQHKCIWIFSCFLLFYFYPAEWKTEKWKCWSWYEHNMTKCAWSLSRPKARHQNLMGHELVNYELICEGNSNYSVTYVKWWKLGQTYVYNLRGMGGGRKWRYLPICGWRISVRKAFKWFRHKEKLKSLPLLIWIKFSTVFFFNQGKKKASFSLLWANFIWKLVSPQERHHKCLLNSLTNYTPKCPTVKMHCFYRLKSSQVSRET